MKVTWHDLASVRRHAKYLSSMSNDTLVLVYHPNLAPLYQLCVLEQHTNEVTNKNSLFYRQCTILAKYHKGRLIE